MAIHEFDHDQEVFLVVWGNRVTKASKVGTGVGSTKGLSYATDRL